MNLNCFFDHLPYMAYAFNAISTIDRIKLEHALRVLQNIQHLKSVYFLGKLYGTQSNYCLAFGSTGRDVFRDRKLFYSQNHSDWYLLMEPKFWSNDWEYIKSPFVGDPAFKLHVDLGPEFTLDDDQIPFEGKRKRFTVKEEDRLWFTTTKLLQEATIVPRGMLYHSTEGFNVINPFYGGMNGIELTRIANYQHFREPIYDVKKNLSKREDCSYFMDIFDVVAENAIPTAKSFIMTHDCERDVLVFKSLVWPGMNCYQRVNSDIGGFFYIGNGVKNWDLLFIV